MLSDGRQQLLLELAECLRDQDWRQLASVLADLINNDERYNDERQNP